MKCVAGSCLCETLAAAGARLFLKRSMYIHSVHVLVSSTVFVFPVFVSSTVFLFTVLVSSTVFVSCSCEFHCVCFLFL